MGRAVFGCEPALVKANRVGKGGYPWIDRASRKKFATPLAKPVVADIFPPPLSEP